VNTRQKAFVKHYIACGYNASEAARLAGYSPKRVHVHAARLLANASVQAELQKQLRAVLNNLDEAGAKLLRLIEHACRFDLRRAVEWGPGGIRLKDCEDLKDLDALMITEVSETIGKYGSSTKIKTISKEKAWEMMAKFTKLIDSDREMEPEEERLSLSREERKKKILEYSERLKSGKKA
jgi:phage terminase small subunit